MIGNQDNRNRQRGLVKLIGFMFMETADNKARQYLIIALIMTLIMRLQTAVNYISLVESIEDNNVRENRP